MKSKMKLIILILLLLAFIAAPLAAVFAQDTTGTRCVRVKGKKVKTLFNKDDAQTTNTSAPDSGAPASTNNMNTNEANTATTSGMDMSGDSRIASVLQPNRAPLVTFRMVFMTGAAADPKGKEGLANLTASMLAGGGTRARSFDEITNAFYPMAAGFGSQVDKEMTVFAGTTHLDNLDRYYAIISEMLLDPGFRQEDFTRLRTGAVNYLKTGLRESNDEELGKERLYNVIYAGHPYAHNNVGTVSSLLRITIDDVRDFYRRNYTQSALTLGLAGNYPATLPARITKDFARLPAGTTSKMKFATPQIAKGTQFDIIQRETRSTGISMGFPIDVRRGDKDFPALALVASYLGQHRSSNSYLYQRLREIRGLNYGDYAYIEYFPRGMFQFAPDANLGRQSQIFQIWIRPVEPQNAHFALRAALYEFDKLVKNGMTAEAFETTREFLSKYTNVLTQTQDAQLGYALDSRYYGITDFNTYMRQELARLTLDDVNRAIKRHLSMERMRVVMVTKDAEALRQAIIANTASPITYNSPKPDDILAEDKIIESYRVEVKPEDVRIVPVAQVFE